MTVAGTVGGADLAGLYFNLDPNLDPTSLVFTRVSGTGPTAADTEPILTGGDAFMPDGDGLHDILFDFPPQPGNDAARFNAGEDLVYGITGIASLTASSFNFFSTPNPEPGSAGPYISVARFLSTGSDEQGSDWVGVVPEPSTAALLILGIIGLLPIARRRIRR